MSPRPFLNGTRQDFLASSYGPRQRAPQRPPAPTTRPAPMGRTVGEIFAAAGLL